MSGEDDLIIIGSGAIKQGIDPAPPWTVGDISAIRAQLTDAKNWVVDNGNDPDTRQALNDARQALQAVIDRALELSGP